MLVVDDNAVNRMVAERMLAVLHCTVVSAATGREAVARAQQERFDLILVDCRMPDMDGYKATERLLDLASLRAGLGRWIQADKASA